MRAHGGLRWNEGSAQSSTPRMTLLTGSQQTSPAELVCARRTNLYETVTDTDMFHLKERRQWAGWRTRISLSPAATAESGWPQRRNSTERARASPSAA